MIKQQTGWSKYIIGIWWISDVLKQNTWSWKFIQVRACVCLIYIWHTWSLKSVIVARTLMKNRINDTSGGVSHSGQRELTVSQQSGKRDSTISCLCPVWLIALLKHRSTCTEARVNILIILVSSLVTENKIAPVGLIWKETDFNVSRKPHIKSHTIKQKSRTGRGVESHLYTMETEPRPLWW